MSIHDLSETRLAALHRVQKAIVEMQDVLKNSCDDTPARVLVGGILKTLKKTEARLESGITRARQISK